MKLVLESIIEELLAKNESHGFVHFSLYSEYYLSKCYNKSVENLSYGYRAVFRQKQQNTNMSYPYFATSSHVLEIVLSDGNFA